MLLAVQNPFVNFPFISQEQIKIKIELHSYYILDVILRIFNGLNIEFRAHNKSGKSGWEGGFWPWKSGQGEGSRGTGNPGGRGGQNLLPSVGGVWIFSGITQCTEILQSLTNNKQNKDIVRDVLRKYRNKYLVKHHVHIKPGFGRPFVISVEQIRRKCVFIDILPNNACMISRFPDVNEHN